MIGGEGCDERSDTMKKRVSIMMREDENYCGGEGGGASCTDVRASAIFSRLWWRCQLVASLLVQSHLGRQVGEDHGGVG